MQSSQSSVGRFPTRKASQYMQQLCKHFGHKIDVTFDEHSASAALPPGPCEMWAEDGELRIEVSAGDADGLARAQSIIDKHLERFAFRESFKTMDWA